MRCSNNFLRVKPNVSLKMSVLSTNSTGWVISHEDFIRKIYRNVILNGENVALKYSISFFHIITPYMFNTQVPRYLENKLKKRKRKIDDSDGLSDLEVKNLIKEETKDVKFNSDVLIKNAQMNGYLHMLENEDKSSQNNLDARLSSERFFNELSEQNMPSSNGGNCNAYAIVVSCHGQDFVFPADSRFYCCDVKEFPSKIQLDEVYDLILMDPPWWNKYIRRKRSKNAAQGYKMMYNSEFKELAIGALLSEEGLVAVWCTNCVSHIDDLINDIFPVWGIKYVATWYWIKVTKRGQPVCAFSEYPGKQPYERIIFGSKSDRKKKYYQPEDKKCIISVPSAIHSHKPPLADILAHYLPPSPRCLELFARYLLPNWTSCGNQVLSLQNIKLFTQEIEPVIVK